MGVSSIESVSVARFISEPTQATAAVKSADNMKKGMLKMVEKADRLFLRSMCIECGKVRAVVDFDAVLNDDFRGSRGQELLVFSSLSLRAEAELLSSFGVEGSCPAILTYDGAVITEAKNVILHLRRNQMAKG